MPAMNRRDLLRLSGALAGVGALAGLLPELDTPVRNPQQLPNIIILVLDAMSAKNLSLYGYARHTTANLESLAERSLVYHRHYANGSFTTSGTASLLTGLRPWTHRALNASGLIGPQHVDRNLFRLLGPKYLKLAYTQNYWADYLLNQLAGDIDAHIPLSSFGLLSDAIVDQRFTNDALVAYRSYGTTFFPWLTEQPSSLLLSFFYNLYYQARVRDLTPADYPLGLPASNTLHYVFSLETVMDGLLSIIADLESHGSPYLSYLHLWPPHDPYRPRREFVGRFAQDGYVPPEKPQHSLSTDFSTQGLGDHRREYDEYVAHLDAELGRLIRALDDQGILEHSYLFVTSDHGEMFERGVLGHFTPLLYEPVIRIPLLVSVPGKREHRDIYSPTANVDLLPTLLHIAGSAIPEWCEGKLLPELGGRLDPDRSIVSMDAKENPAKRPLTHGTFSLIKGGFKLTYYTGYKERYERFFEFYDLEQDPEELHDLKDKSRVAAKFSEMKNELLEGMAAADKPYR